MGMIGPHFMYNYDFTTLVGLLVVDSLFKQAELERENYDL